MTAIEITLVLFLNVFTVFCLASLGWVMVVVPLKEEMAQLKRIQSKTPKAVPYMAPPKNLLPDMDDLPDDLEIGEYGEPDPITPEQAEEEMSDLQSAVREANQAWLEMEDMRHGKSNPLIYTG